MYRLKMNPLSNQKAIISDVEYALLLPIDKTKYEPYSPIVENPGPSVDADEDEDDNSSDLTSAYLTVAEELTEIVSDSSSDSSPASDSDSFGGFDGGDTGGGGASSDY